MKNNNLPLALIILTIITSGCVSEKAVVDEGNENNGAAQIVRAQQERVKGLTLTGVIRNGVREVELKTFQFGWEPENIILRSGEKVRITVVSLDVPHGFEIHGIKSDNWEFEKQINPGEPAVIEFTAPSPGEYEFVCSVYCGIDHAKMAGKIIVVE